MTSSELIILVIESGFLMPNGLVCLPKKVRYRSTETNFLTFSKETDLVYCYNFPRLLDKNFKTQWRQWRLFFDSFKRSLKAVLLHSGNKQASLLVSHSVHMKETNAYKINYKDHQ